MQNLPSEKLDGTPRYFWLEGALSGGFVFPLVWLLAGHFWLSTFPSVVAAYGFSDTDSIPLLLVGLLPSLAVAGLGLGAVTGWCWELWPRPKGRILAFLSGCGGCVWAVCQIPNPISLIPILLNPAVSNKCEIAWFRILPYSVPFAWSLALVFFALLLKSRPIFPKMF